MRLSREAIDSIKAQKTAIFSHNSKIMLFGSRIDDFKRGGDIDLFIECDKSYNTFKNSIQFKSRLKSEIGEQKIDLIIKNFNESDDRPIVAEALRTGILL